MPTEKTLQGHLALVTGSAVRVGRVLVLALAEQGAAVAVHYNASPDKATEVVELIRRAGGTSEMFSADLMDDTERMNLIPSINRKMGIVDILVNSAALFGEAHFLETTPKEWDENFELNLKAPFRLSQAFAMQENSTVQGNIVNISDWRGLRPGIDHFAYTVTKAALIKMTESMALALAPRIRVNCLALGSILPPPRSNSKMIEGLVAQTPLKKMGSPEEVAQALLYLLSSTNYVTGTTITIDGGRHLVT